jgi:hypothetical protein
MKLPQLSFRELFLLVVIAAMGCGWWVNSIRLGELQSRLTDLELMNDQCQTAVERAGYAVYFSTDGPFLIKKPESRSANP